MLYDVLKGTRDLIYRKTLRVLIGFSFSEKLSSCKDIVIQSLLVIDLFLCTADEGKVMRGP